MAAFQELEDLVPRALVRKLQGATSTAEVVAAADKIDRKFRELRRVEEILVPLVDPGGPLAKNGREAATWRQRGNAAFRERDFQLAAQHYTTGLTYAPFATPEQRKVAATLFANRAACLQQSHGLLQGGRISAAERASREQQRRAAMAAAERDCGRAIALNASYSKAWFRRGCLRAARGATQGAREDLGRALALEEGQPSAGQVAAELAKLPPPREGPSAAASWTGEGAAGLEGRVGCVPEVSGPRAAEDSCAGRQPPASRAAAGAGRAEMYLPPGKGRGLRATRDLAAGDVVVSEAPFAAILLKPERQSHCHFCFLPLPPDPVPCWSCVGALYCSAMCRGRAGFHAPGGATNWGSQAWTEDPASPRHLVNDAAARREAAARPLDGGPASPAAPEEEPPSGPGEHWHECGGSSWATCLQVQGPLAARVLVRCLWEEAERPPRRTPEGEEGATWRPPGGAAAVGELSEALIATVPPADRVPLCVLAAIVAACVRAALARPEERHLAASGRVGAGALVKIMAQLRSNAMAVSRRVSCPPPGPGLPAAAPGGGTGEGGGWRRTGGVSAEGYRAQWEGSFKVEQIEVGQGLYLAASLLNHSCEPNVFASFAGRRAVVRAVTGVPAGAALELTYGPQRGEKLARDRRRWLEKRYAFQCHCSACAGPAAISDLYLQAFRCATPGCLGAVPSPGGEEEEAPLPQWTAEGGRVPSGAQGGAELAACSACGAVADLRTLRAAALCDLDHAAATPGASSLVVLGRVLHPYSRSLAEANDAVAEALCRAGRSREALPILQTAISGLEKLYAPWSIQLAEERAKLATVAAAAGAAELADAMARAARPVFAAHYGDAALADLG